MINQLPKNKSATNRQVKKLSQLITVMFLILCVCLFGTYYICQEKFLYYWDYLGYWNVWRALPEESLSSILHSIKNDDYNKLAVLPLWPFLYLNLPERLEYILGIIIVYYIPCIFLIIYLILNTVKYNFVSFAIIIACLLFSPLWFPLLRGYPDICGEIFVLLSIIISFKRDFSKKINFQYAALMGFLLWMPFVLRRWYAYTIIILYLSLPIINYINYNNLLKIYNIKNLLINFTISGIISLVFCFIFQNNVIKRIIKTNYGDIYSGYNFGFETSVQTFIDNIGWGYIIFVFAPILLFKLLDKRDKNLYVFSTVNLVVTFVFFISTQTPSPQHLIPFYTLSLISYGLFIKNITKLLADKHQIFIYFVPFIAIVYSSYSFIYSLTYKGSTTNWVEAFLPKKELPLMLNQYDQYINLQNYINLSIDAKDKIAIFSSSGFLNDSMFLSNGDKNVQNKILLVSHVDLRDFINLNPFLAKNVIITNPVQLHLKKGSQRVIEIPVNEIVNNSTIGKYYRFSGYSFYLDNNVEAKIYKKIARFSIEDSLLFLRKFYSYYPSWENIYENNNSLHINFLSSEFIPGDIYGSISIDSNGIIHTHPGENTPSTLYIDLWNVKKLKFYPTNSRCNIDDKIKISFFDEKKQTLIKNFYLDKKSHLVVNIDTFNIPRYSILKFYKVNNSGCDSIAIEKLQ
ncbi:hypothetical protein M3084_10440 [Succinatimonas hippei]|uniref:hypothetical protein n=1 Tax=Succinatimonas hippei TaxID=626938 RepID=UPI00201194E2|nr:hypothetical protein [Succinatimonas hippei]MCL1604258.1 hypothetical protein [Succinatimonas hippei]